MFDRKRCGKGQGDGDSGRKVVGQRYSYQVTIPELLRVFSRSMECANILLVPRPGRAGEEP